MTCIVGLVHKNKVYLGGDSAAVADSHYLSDAGVSKIFRNGEFIMGYTSSFRMGQILEYKFKPPSLDDEDVLRFMVTKFVDAVRATMKEEGIIRKVNEVEDLGQFLVGVRGQLFAFEEDYTILPREYDAVGCGVSVALGSLFSTVGQKPQKRLVTALEAASRFTTGVRAPFHIIKE